MNQANSDKPNNLLRQLPSVDIVLKQLTELIQQYGHQQVSKKVQFELAQLREAITNGTADIALSAITTDAIIARIHLVMSADKTSTMVQVFNLSGTVLHTNLGRAVLPQQALDAVIRVASSPSNLEYDLNTGQRGERDNHIEKLICELTGAEAATAVNNNAAAVLLVLNTLAMAKEVPISRGELVEIGGSFRIPEVMQRSGTTIVEVGTTNRTHLKDYENALTQSTGALLKVHTSNYRIEGFTNEVPEQELAALAHRHQLPFIFDLGSGSLINNASLAEEQTVSEVLAKGVDIVTFSGDKLLGGPQCGVIAGRKDLIDKIRQNPLKRALRLDKMTLAALAEVLKLYRHPETLTEHLPTLKFLSRPVEEIHKQAKAIIQPLQEALPETFKIDIVDCFSQIGSGALPVETIPSIALAISSIKAQDSDIRYLAEKMRQLNKPVITRIHKGVLLLDLRCLDDETGFLMQLETLSEKLR